jgi:hypothetical protein
VNYSKVGEYEAKSVMQGSDTVEQFYLFIDLIGGLISPYYARNLENKDKSF